MSHSSRNRFVLSTASILLTAGLISCSGAPPRNQASEAQPAAAATPVASEAAAQPANPITRKIVRDAKLTLAVQSVPTTFQDIRSAISGWGGYLANSDFRREPLDNQQATLQIRVPSEALDKVLAKLALMGRVVNQAESGQDVTDAYVDLESQLRNLRMAEQRLLQLMEKTGSVKDLLEVQTQVTETRGRIETIQGQLKAMDNKVSFATVDIQLQERQPIASEKFWNLGETFHDAQSMFMELLRAVITLSIYILFLIPFALPFVLFSWVWYRKSRRQRHTANAGEPKFTPRRAAESEPRVGADPGDAH